MHNTILYIAIIIKVCMLKITVNKTTNFRILKYNFLFGRHRPVEKVRLHFSTGGHWRSTSMAAFFLVDGRQPFSSRPRKDYSFTLLAKIGLMGEYIISDIYTGSVYIGPFIFTIFVFHFKVSSGMMCETWLVNFKLWETNFNWI